MNDDMMAPLLKVPEAAQYLNLSKAKVYQLIGQGLVPTIKIGRSTRIEPEALRTFVRMQAAEGDERRGER